MAFKLGTRVVSGEAGNEAVTLELEPAAGGERETLAADVVLVAIGRRPFTEGLGLDEIGVARDRAGRIEVNEDFATNIPGIYAIGDVIRGPMLAHKAEEEGIALRRAPRRSEDAGRVRRDPRRRLYVARDRRASAKPRTS